MSVINFSIDLNLIDKSKIKVVTKKDGSVGKYINVSLLMKDQTEGDTYGNHGFGSQDVTKEEREAGKKGIILGNAKWAKAPEQFTQAAAHKQAKAQPAAQAEPIGGDDDLPF